MTNGSDDPELVERLEQRAYDLMQQRDVHSLRQVGEAAVWFESGGARGRAVAVLAPHGSAERDGAVMARFAGAGAGRVEDAGDGLALLHVPVGPGTAAALREVLPNLQPAPLGLVTSAGFGDRLGMATPGHVAAMVRAGATGQIGPIFAQQSIREMTRTKRSAQEVMDDATIGAFEAGWSLPVGADADHLKTPEHVLTCVAAGFTFFTIDPSEHVDDEAEAADDETLRSKVAALPWSRLEDDWASLRSRFLAGPLDAGGVSISFDEHTLARAAAKYGAALAHTADLHRVVAGTGAPSTVEASGRPIRVRSSTTAVADGALCTGSIARATLSRAPGSPALGPVTSTPGSAPSP